LDSSSDLLGYIIPGFVSDVQFLADMEAGLTPAAAVTANTDYYAYLASWFMMMSGE